MIQKFDESKLPSPMEFYSGELSRIQPERGGWIKALCPFHDDSNPSFSVNVKNGGYNCFSCGAKGGDIVDFYRQKYGVDFITAVKSLGAMGDAPEGYKPKKQDDKKLVIEKFRKWEISYLTIVCLRMQMIWRFMLNCQDIQESEKMHKLYHYLPTLEMHYAILCSNDDKNKFLLFTEVVNGSI